MRTPILTCAVLFSVCRILAQCGATWNVTSDWGCTQGPQTMVYPSSGGAPPFQITLYAGSSNTVLGSFSNVTAHYSSTAITEPFRAVVTDVNGCVQTTNCLLFASVPYTSAPSPTILPVDPETGVGGFSIPRTSVSVGSLCEQYRIQLSGSTLRSGAMSSDWTPVNSSIVAFRGLLPGSYGVDYSNFGCPGTFGFSNWGAYGYMGYFSLPWPTEQSAYYCNATHGATIPAAGADPDPVRLPIKLLLEGPYVQATGLMNDALRVNGKLPWKFDYASLGYTLTNVNTAENMSVPSRAVTGNDAYVDWVVVELRDAVNPAMVVYSRAALLQRDGDLVMLNGQGPLSCNVPAGSYYVSVKHRNHLGVMTAAPVAVGLSTPVIDFTAATTATYGTNARKQVGDKWVLWSGNANGNSTLSYTGTGNDRDPILTAVGSATPNNSVTNVYDRRDTNLDGVIKYTGTGNDRDIILTNVGSTTPNNTRTQQLP